jgi:hypothetical protein
MSTVLERMRIRLRCADYLATLMKYGYTLKRLSELTGYPLPRISRYKQCNPLPSYYIARDLVGLLEGEVRKVIRRELEDGNGYRILSDPGLIRVVVLDCIESCLKGKVVNALLSTPDALPLATQLLEELFSADLGVSITIAKPTKEVGVREFVEETYFYPSGDSLTLHAPAHTIKEGDSVVMTLTIIEDGRAEILSRMVRKYNAKPALLMGLKVDKSFRNLEGIPIYVFNA